MVTNICIQSHCHCSYGIMLKQVEHAKQDDTLSDLSNLLDELKYMAVDMGTEIERLVVLLKFSASNSNLFC